jgi:hypothetical protein
MAATPVHDRPPRRRKQRLGSGSPAGGVPAVQGGPVGGRECVWPASGRRHKFEVIAGQDRGTGHQDRVRPRMEYFNTYSWSRPTRPGPRARPLTPPPAVGRTESPLGKPARIWHPRLQPEPDPLRTRPRTWEEHDL